MPNKKPSVDLVVAVLAAALLVGGCGSGEPVESGEPRQTVAARESARVSAASIEELYEAAQREGQVTAVAFDPRDVEWMGAAFAEAFPGIELNVRYDLEHLRPVVRDARSPDPRVDVVLTSLMEGDVLETRGLLARNDWALFGVPSNRIGLDGTFGFTNNIVYTVAYDVNRVGPDAAGAAAGAAGAIPATWRELLEPGYQGRLATNAFVMSRVVAGLGLRWGKDEAVDYAESLKGRGLLLQFGDARRLFLDENREQTYFVGMVSTVTEQWKEQGLQFDYVVPEPVIMEQQGAAVLATAPHPAAARLLAGWLASEQGKAARRRDARSADLLPDSSDPLARALHARNVDIVYDTRDAAALRAEVETAAQLVFADRSLLGFLRAILR